jgi:hypothetical protein
MTEETKAPLENLDTLTEEERIAEEAAIREGKRLSRGPIETNVGNMGGAGATGSAQPDLAKTNLA